MDLFDYMRENTIKQESPLASRLRPQTLDEVVGQQHIIGKDKLLYRAIQADKLSSIIFTDRRERERRHWQRSLLIRLVRHLNRLMRPLPGKRYGRHCCQGKR